MNFRTTLVLAAFLVILVGAFVFVSQTSPSGEEWGTPRLFEGVDRDRVVRVRVENVQSGYRVLLERSETEGWRLKEPLDVPADDAVARQFVDDVLHNPGELELDLRRSPSADLAVYGLSPPRAILDYELRGPKGREEETVRRRLLVGTEDVDKNKIFCALGPPLEKGGEAEWKPTVVKRTPGNIWNSVNRSVNDYRDPRVFTIRSWDADGIEVSQEGKLVLALAKEEGTWKVTVPRRDRADPTAASGFVSQVLGWRVHSFADDAPGPDSTYGLDPARREVAVRGGGKTERLRVGEERGSDGVLVRRDEMRFVWGLEAGDLAALDRDPLEFLDRKVFRHFRDEVKEVRIGAGEGQIALAKDGFQWKIRSPRESDADREAVDDLLGSIERLEIQRFEPGAETGDEGGLGRFGLDAPGRSIQVTAGTKGLATGLLVGGEVEGGGARYVRREGSENVGRIASEALAFLEGGFLRYVSKEIASFSEFDLAAIEVEAEGGRARWLRGESNRWEKEGAEGEASPAFTESLDAILHLKGEAAESESAEGFPFDAPVLTLRFYKGSPTSRPAEGAEPSLEVKVAERDGVYYAASPSGIVYRIAADLASKLRALP